MSRRRRGPILAPGGGAVAARALSVGRCTPGVYHSTGTGWHGVTAGARGRARAGRHRVSSRPAEGTGWPSGGHLAV